MPVAGAVLPWARVGSLSFTGTDGGGLLTLILAIVALVAVAVWRGRRWVLIFSVIAAVLSGLIVMVNVSDVSRLASGFDIVSTGPGLWISAIAVALWTLASIVALARAKTFRPTVSVLDPSGLPAARVGRPDGLSGFAGRCSGRQQASS
jgi:hypothetical protein